MAQRADIRNEAVDLLQKALQPQYVGWDDQYRAVVSVLMGQPNFLSRMLEEALYEKDHYDALELCEKDAIDEGDPLYFLPKEPIVPLELYFSERAQGEYFFDAMLILWWGMGDEEVNDYWRECYVAEG